MQINDLKGLYIAHRGIHNDKTIENTTLAFSKAIERNSPIEFDIQILKDGNLVVYHDDNLKRLMGIDRKLSSYSYEELEKLTFPNLDTHIPLFSDLLRLVNGRVLLVIEIKKTDIISYKKYCEKIVSILKNYSGDFVIKSFDIRIVSWFLKNTDYVTGLLMIRRKKSSYDFIINKRITLSVLNPDFISVSTKIVSSKLVQNFRKKHPVLVWTIKNRNSLDMALRYGDSFLIDEESIFDDINVSFN